MRKFVVLGIAKNIENQVTILGDCLQAILDQREGSRAFIYEDGSTDKTADRLEALAKDSRITVKLDNSELPKTEAATWDNKPCRLECIAWARNECMKMWEAEDKEDCIIIWLDCDRVQRLDACLINQLGEQLMGVPIEVACGFFAYSVNHKGEMYDTFAYRSEKHALGPEIMGEEWWSAENQRSIRSEVAECDQPSFKVISACNGLAMYKSEAIRGLRFSALPTPLLEKYYKQIWRNEKAACNKKLCTLQIKPKTHTEGVCLGRYCFGTEGMWYKNNSGYNQPVVCEWISFHLGIKERGYEGLFIIKPWIDKSGH
jgi:glycosyltransferase involved in cell wall biosynthesis